MNAEQDENDLILPKLPAVMLLQRQAEERDELQKRLNKIKSSIPRKDRAGRSRAEEQAAEDEGRLLAQQAAEREENNVQLEDVTTFLSKSNTSGDLESANNNILRVNEPRKESKAARRRRKKAEQEAESQLRVETEKANMGPSPKFTESEEIDKQLRPMNLRIHPILADGHCLYSAVAHQMLSTQLQSEISATVEGLREATADYLISHKKEFMPFIETVNGDEGLFQKYCEELRSTAVWGGQVEVKIMAELLGTCIEIYAANMPVVRMGDMKGAGPVLRLSFHREYFGLGEHYNSIISKP